MLKIVGDINFSDGFFDMGFGVGAAIRKGFDPFAKLYRKRTDFWIGNLECAGITPILAFSVGVVIAEC